MIRFAIALLGSIGFAAPIANAADNYGCLYLAFKSSPNCPFKSGKKKIEDDGFFKFTTVDGKNSKLFGSTKWKKVEEDKKVYYEPSICFPSPCNHLYIIEDQDRNEYTDQKVFFLDGVFWDDCIGRRVTLVCW